MRSIVLAIGLSSAIALHHARGEDPTAASPTAFDVAAAPSQTALSKDQIEHLKAAADHLAKAGSKEEADRLREHITALEAGEAEALLAKKEKELTALQGEVLQLRNLIRPRAAVTLSFHLLELSRAKIKLAGFADAEKLFGTAADKSPLFQVSQRPSEVVATIDQMRKRGLIKVLGEPTMCTMLGETLSFHSGGEVPVQRLAKDGTVVEDKVEFGTRIEAQPTLTETGKLRLPLYMRVTDLDEVTKATTTAGKTPGFTVETVLEMEFGKAYMLGGLRLRRIQAQPNIQAKPAQESEASETFVIVTAERLDLTKQAAAPNTGPQKPGFYSPARAIAAPATPKLLR